MVITLPRRRSVRRPGCRRASSGRKPCARSLIRAVQAHAELVAEERAGRDAAEMSEIRVQQVAVHDSSLLVALPIGKEEDAVAADRTAEREAELPPLEERIGIRGIAGKSRIRGQRVVAKEVEAGAVEIVASGARDHVDRACVGGAGRKIEIGGWRSETPAPLPERSPSASRQDPTAMMLPPSTVTRVPRPPDPVLPPGAPKIGTNMRLLLLARRGLHARFEFGQFEKTAAVQRQVLDLAPA